MTLYADRTLTQQEELGYAAVQRQLSEANRKVAALVTALESGVAIADLTAALRQRTAERDELTARLERVERPCAMPAAQISELVQELGGLSAVLNEATGSERAQVYASLGLRLDHDLNFSESRQLPTLVVSPDVSEGGLEPPRPLIGH